MIDVTETTLFDEIGVTTELESEEMLTADCCCYGW